MNGQRDVIADTIAKITSPLGPRFTMKCEMSIFTDWSGFVEIRVYMPVPPSVLAKWPAQVLFDRGEVLFIPTKTEPLP